MFEPSSSAFQTDATPSQLQPHKPNALCVHGTQKISVHKNKNGSPRGIRTHTVHVLSVTPPTDWARELRICQYNTTSTTGLSSLFYKPSLNLNVAVNPSDAPKTVLLDTTNFKGHPAEPPLNSNLCADIAVPVTVADLGTLAVPM